MDSTYKVTITIGQNSIQFVPQEQDFAYQDVDFESGRSSEGTMHRNVVASKRKYTFVLPPMSNSELNAIIGPVSAATSFQASVPDPIASGGYYTGTFYHGDIQGSAYNYALDIWDTSSFSIIEY